jgi:hypothetical protein
MAGKMDVIPWPARRDQRFDQRFAAGRDVAGEERPDVVAAEALAPFDQQQPQLGPQPCQCQGDQAAGKASAKDGDVTVMLAHHPKRLAGERNRATRVSAETVGDRVGDGRHRGYEARPLTHQSALSRQAR